MLNILCCIKQVPDVDQVKMDPETGSLIRAGVPAILNPLDANALEAALQVKERYGGTICCVTMGPEQAAEALRECLASGADKAVLLSDRAFANADTLATSYVIYMAAKNLGKFDLIFCGKESLDGATGQMAAQLAERFDAGLLSSVLKIQDLDEEGGCITAIRELENGKEVAQALLPCLITVEKQNFRPKLPSLKSWIASRRAEIFQIDSGGIPGLDFRRIGDPGSPTKVPRIYPPKLGERGIMIDCGNMKENLDQLMDVLAQVL